MPTSSVLRCISLALVTPALACDGAPSSLDPATEGQLLVALGAATEPTGLAEQIKFEVAGSSLAEPLSGELVPDAPAPKTWSLTRSLPVGRGYSITITAYQSNGDPLCVGATSFGIEPGVTTTMDVLFDCIVGAPSIDDPGSNSTLVVIDANVCPEVQHLVVSPPEIGPGQVSTIEAFASDPDGERLAFDWFAGAGDRLDSSGPQVAFECARSGRRSVAAMISDGDPRCAVRRDLDIECIQSDFRSIDGFGNNLASPTLGAAGTQLRRVMPPAYADGAAAPAGPARRSSREISNVSCAQTESMPNAFGASDYVWQWGQFLDHDITISEVAGREDAMDIPVPPGDPFFDPTGSGTQLIEFTRSVFDPTTGSLDAPRNQLNEITAFIDASQVYGSDESRALALRTMDGTGKLRTSAGDLLPFNTEGLPNAEPGADQFLAGDVRANENVGLTAMHTLFVREHNRLATDLAASEPELSGDAIYERVRSIVAGLMQHITYDEFLPAVMGPDPLSPYAGYDPAVDPGIANVFSTAVFRWGHSALSPTLLRLDENGEEIDAGHLSLRDAFFQPERVLEAGIDPVLRGLAALAHQRIDALVIDDVRSFLFGPPGAGGLDLAALNIQRGRDHGLPSYNDVREALGFARHDSFTDVSTDPDVQQRMAQAYEDIDDVDLWLGALCEDPVNGSQLGELSQAIMRMQFEALRDGDRYWFENALFPNVVAEIKSTTLADVIRRNTSIGDELHDRVFWLGP